MAVASVTGSVTSFVGDHGVYAVFALMLVAAILPAASELVMLYAGAVAAGAFSSAHVVVFGNRVSFGLWAFVAMTVAGIAGNLGGTVLGWAIGRFGGRPLLERHGRWLHVTPARLGRAEGWFDRYGPVTVPVGLAVPVARSFVAIPAGIARMRLERFVLLALVGCTVFCTALAGAGWGLGRSYDRFHGAIRYVDYAVVAAAVAVAVFLSVRRLRSSRLRRRAPDPAG